MCIDRNNHLNFVGDEVKEGDIRLVGGRYMWEGRVEIFLHGVWGTVSDDGTSSTDAVVVCRQLGYNTFSKAHLGLPFCLCVAHKSFF